MKIVFTGPECSGKTDLSLKIAEKYSFGYVREVAREYLDLRNNTYNYEDLSEIAKLQVAEEKRIGLDYNFICADTDLLTIVIWSEEKYNRVDPIITELWKADFAEMYFLCSPDIPWTYDPQRENPHDRDRLFDIHQTILKENNLPFQIISGDFENRISLVTQIINRMNINTTFQ